MTERKTIDRARLRRLLEAYGAEPARWPAAEREAALALLGRSVEAAALRSEAAELDRLLDEAALPQASPELMAEVLADASLSPWRRWAVALWPFGPIWKPASALAMAATLGIVVGLLLPTQEFVDRTQIAAEIDGLLFAPTAGMWIL